MSESDIKKALGQLLSDAEEIMAELGDKFKFHDFWQKAVRRHQHAYINLLVACSETENPFELAHLKMGEALKHKAAKAGYRCKSKKHGGKSIFGTDTSKTTYRKE